MTDLEAEVDDQPQEWLDEDIEEVLHANASHRIIHEEQEPHLSETDAAQADLAVQLLSLASENHSTPGLADSQHISQSSLPTLISRHDAQSTAPFPPRHGESSNSTVDSPVQFLRPITPTAPLIVSVPYA